MNHLSEKLPWENSDQDGNTALHIAASEGLCDVIELLLTRVIYLRSSVSKRNNARKTASQLAEENRFQKIVNLLHKYLR